MLPQPNLDELIRKTIALYNRYHSPEATAKLVSLTPEAVTISFSGSFCYSCGVTDYIEDFIHEAKILSDKVELKMGRNKQTSPRTFEAEYKIKLR